MRLFSGLSNDVDVGDFKKKWTPFLRQFFVTMGVSLNMAGAGLVMGISTALLQQLREADSVIPIDDSSGSWIAAIPGLTFVFGIVLAPPSMAHYGRKISNVMTIAPLLLSWILIYFANNITILLVARFLQGVSMGMSTALGSLLIGEYTSPKNRGAFLMTISLTIALAVLCVHLTGSYLSWQYTALICGAVATLDLLIVLYSPESPSWLAEKGKYEACEKSFRWLRGDGEEEELKKLIEASIFLNETKANLIECKSFAKRFVNKMEYFNQTIRKREFLKPIIIMFHMYILSQWSGINIFVAYPVDMFQNMFATNFASNMPLLLLSLDINRLVANTMALYVIQKVKRRTILLSIVTINIIALLSCACYSYAKLNHYIYSEEYIAAIFLVHLHMFTVATGSLPMCFILAGEIFPLEYRGLAGGISVFLYSINLFLSVKIVPLMLSTLYLYGMYGLYTLVLIYSLIMVWYLLPETKDRTLQDIEDEFRGKTGGREELKSV